MAVPTNELREHSDSIESSLAHAILFPKFRSFIVDGKLMGDEVVDLLTEPEITWLRKARVSSLHGEKFAIPESERNFPHLIGFSLTGKPES